MSGVQRCDEIMRTIDEVLASFGEVQSQEHPARTPKPTAADGEQPAWRSLVRWGAVPMPLVIAG